ncbi:MAG: POTRA domain-containing protein [Edaphobacter sp.]
MRIFRVVRNLSALVCLVATPALAQYTLKKIVFNGTTPYSQAVLEAASGLKPGDKVTNDTLQQTAQRLSDTGAFGDLQVTFDGPASAMSIIFKIMPLDPSHQLTAAFDNFIWFTPEELEAGLRARVPLFTSVLPESGNLQDVVQTALVDMLKEKGVTATITHEVYEPSAENPMRIVAYRVKTPAIVLHSINLTGVSQEFAATVRDISSKLVGRPYNEGPERLTTAVLLLTPYLKAGYLNAQLTNRTLTPATSSPERIDADLTAAVNAGIPFHIGDIVWAGSTQISSEAFTAAAPLHSGDLANPITLAKSVELLAAAYRKQGYADVVVSPKPSIDASAGRVSYTFSVVTGDVYRIRTITPLNLTPAQQKDFAHGWTLKAGDVFNSEYITNFLQQNTALRSFDNCSATFKAVRDPESHLVDVTVPFVCGVAHPGR